MTSGRKNENGKWLASVATGLVVSIAIAILGVAILTTLISGESITQSGTSYGVGAVVFVSTYIGAMIAAKKVGERRLTVCLMTAAGYYLIAILLSLALFGGGLSGAGVMAILVFGAGGTAGLLRMNTNNKGSRRKRIRRH